MRSWLFLGALCALACGAEAPAPTAETSGAPTEETTTETTGEAGDPAESAGGVQIEHVSEGSGPQPAATDVVQVHYHGTFPDGSVFDSSRQRGQPASFPLNRVIACWTEALQTMKVGGTARLVCPPESAYGARGAPPRIPANATLHFEVELLGIQ